MKRIFLLFFFSLLIIGCRGKPLNYPYAISSEENVYFSSFFEQAKTLDPARSYSADEWIFLGQIVEPPLQFDYLKRPYTLVPATAKEVPKPIYVDSQGKALPDNASDKDVAYSLYTIHIQPGIYYQDHPAFSQNPRELTAEDYIYEIKRLADPTLQSPIFGLMSKYIEGLEAYQQILANAHEKKGKNQFVDLREYPLSGVTLVDRYTYQIKIKGKYPQFLYWLALPFFAPIPAEVDAFYQQAALREKNISLDTYPVGTGPYAMVENNPNARVVLKRNPHFRAEFYPSHGSKADEAAGLLALKGQRLPFIDQIIFTLEKESIPRWNKFLQGYYDASSVGSDSFEQAIQMSLGVDPSLTPELKEKGIRLQTSISPTLFYIGFNMEDPVIGGLSLRAKKLRQAISIALDYEEFISIFLNGRGEPAQSPIPPGIFGYQSGKKGINPYVYDWKNNHAQRKSIEYAKKLLSEAGYANGIDQKTGRPLVLNYDVPASNGPDDKALFDWMRKQFAKLNIQLNVQATQYNRFQEKMRTGNAQLFSWGWHADYPDPEDFFFLLYSANGKMKYGGENAANYKNPQFDALFNQMKSMPNSPEREAIIQKMIAMVQEDAPWVFGFYPKTYLLSQGWVYPVKPNEIASNTLKYIKIDPKKRAYLQAQWNEPYFWPLLIIAILFLLSLIPVIFQYIKKEHRQPILLTKNKNGENQL